MAQKTFLSEEVKSLSEICNVVKSLNGPTLDETDKLTFKALLSGMKVIVECLQDDAETVDLKIAIQWLQLYAKIFSIVSRCEVKLKIFLKSVPIAITYIIGWLQHAPIKDIQFFTEATNIGINLLQIPGFQIHEALKDLEVIGKGVISLLWDAIDRIGNFDVQMQVLRFFILILKDLDKDYLFWEVRNISKLKSDKIIYKILSLMRTSNDDGFKNLSRSILNQYNLEKTGDDKVQSFYCKTFVIGTNSKFTKPKYANRFWFDINVNPHTLTFEGRIALEKNQRKYEECNVTLEIAEMFMENEILNIQFTPPVKISRIKFTNFKLFQANIARISLSKTELQRFLKSFNVPPKPLAPAEFAPNMTALSTKTKKKLTPRSTKPSSIASNIFEGLKSSSSDAPREAPSTFIDNQKQIQQVKPLYLPSKINSDAHEVETTRPTILDEYENLDVSDAEPCQSYKSFSIRKSSPKENPLPRFKSLKRSLEKEKASADNEPANKIAKDSDVLDYGPSTSKSIPKAHRFGNSSASEDAFDSLRNESSSSRYAYKNKNDPVLLTNDVFNDRAETIIDLTIKSQSPANNVRPEMSEGPTFGFRSSNWTSQSASRELLNYGSLPNFPSHRKKEEDSLVYYKRSDSESSCDESNSEIQTTPKRKIVKKLCKTPARRQLFGRSVSDSEEIVEFLYISKKGFSNVFKIQSELSSFIGNGSSHSSIRGCRDIFRDYDFI